MSPEEIQALAANPEASQIDLMAALQTALADISDFKKLKDIAEMEVAKLKQELEDALTANGGLVAEIEKLSKGATGVVKKVEEKIINLADHVFEFAGKKFGFNYPKLTIGKQVITPVEVTASPELQKQLIEAGSSMIKEITS